MKKSITFLFAVVMGLFALTSCNSSESGPDARDLLLGTYSYTMSGSYTMHFVGQQVDVPLASGGVVKIKKDGSGNRVKMKGTDISANGVVEGDILKLDPESQTQTKDGYTIVLTATYEPAQLVNNKLTINATLAGTIAGGGNAGTIQGSALVIATKY